MAAKAMPVLAIYQNPDHVAGLVQQLFDSPLVTTLIAESDASDETETSLKVEADAKAAGTVKAPLVAKVDVAADLSGGVSRDKVVSTGSKTTQSFVYSQAYYLNLVRRTLKEQELLQPVAGLRDASALSPGQIIEFEATFSPSGITTIMDVVTPDLAAAITRWWTKRSELALFEGYSTFDETQRAAVKMSETANSNAEITREVAVAVQADFRQETTREYYGTVGTGDDAVTIVTICDSDHFVVADEDRILDGSFKVLAKVTSPVEEDVPVLRRNKLLRNLAPDGVDTLIGSMRSTLLEQKPMQIGGEQVDQFLDLQLDSRVSGSSLRVIPIAIYA